MEKLKNFLNKIQAAEVVLDILEIIVLLLLCFSFSRASKSKDKEKKYEKNKK
jgi:hypothetical protein